MSLTVDKILGSLLPDRIDVAVKEGRCLHIPFGCGDSLPPTIDAGNVETKTWWDRYLKTGLCVKCQNRWDRELVKENR